MGVRVYEGVVLLLGRRRMSISVLVVLRLSVVLGMFIVVVPVVSFIHLEQHDESNFTGRTKCTYLVVADIVTSRLDRNKNKSRELYKIALP